MIGVSTVDVGSMTISVGSSVGESARAASAVLIAETAVATASSEGVGSTSGVGNPSHANRTMDKMIRKAISFLFFIFTFDIVIIHIQLYIKNIFVYPIVETKYIVVID